MKHSLVIWDSRQNGKPIYNLYAFGVLHHAESIQALKGQVIVQYPNHVFEFHLSSELKQLVLGEDFA